MKTQMRAAIPLALCATCNITRLLFTAHYDGAPGDFAAFAYASRAVRMHVNPFRVDPFILPAVDPGSPNLNPPAALPVLSLIGTGDPLIAWRVMTVLSIALYLLLVGVLAHSWHGPQRIAFIAWLLSIYPLWETLDEGQIYVPLALLAAGAWLLLPRRPALAGALIGIVIAVKPQFALWPALLLLAGAWPAVLSAGVIAGLLSVLPVAFYGPAVYPEWMAAVHSYGRALIPLNGSLTAFLERSASDVLVVSTVALILGRIGTLIWRHHRDLHHVSALALAAAMAFSPISWPGYALLLLPIFTVRPWPRGVWCAAVVLALPFDFLARTLPLPLAMVLLMLAYPLAYGCMLWSMSRVYEHGIATLVPLREVALTRSR